MKLLTLTQPWATLVAIGAKHYETRSWKTSYRGPLAIHAARGLNGLGHHSTARDDQEAALGDLCQTEPFASVLEAHYGQFFRAGMLPRGAIVAVCDLVEVRATDTCDFQPLRGRSGVHHVEAAEHERAFGDYSPGRWAWLLGDVHALDEPVPCRGERGLQDVPPAIIRKLNERR